LRDIDLAFLKNGIFPWLALCLSLIATSLPANPSTDPEHPSHDVHKKHQLIYTAHFNAGAETYHSDSWLGACDNILVQEYAPAYLAKISGTREEEVSNNGSITGMNYECDITYVPIGTTNTETQTWHVAYYCPTQDGAAINSYNLSNSIVIEGWCPSPPPPPNQCDKSSSGSGGGASSGFGGDPGRKGVGNPVYVGDGAKVETSNDWTSSLDSRFRFDRSYSSKGTGSGGLAETGFGVKWSTPWTQRLQRNGVSHTLSLYGGGGFSFTYNYSTASWESNTFDHSYEFRGSVASEGGRYVVETGSGYKELYEKVNSTLSLLSERRWPDGYSIYFSYDAAANLEAIEDNKGQRAEFSWSDTLNPNQVVLVATKIEIDTDFGGVTFAPELEISYGYDTDTLNTSNLYLVSAVTSETVSNTIVADWEYVYDQSDSVNLRGKLLSVSDGRLDATGNPYGYAQFTYSDTSGTRATSTSHIGNNDTHLISGRTDTATGYDVTVTNPLGKETIYSFERVADQDRIVDVEGVSTSSCLPSNASVTRDTLTGRILERIERNGARTVMTRDSLGRILTRTEDAHGIAPRVTTYTWPASSLRKPLTRQTAELKDTFTYDPEGMLLTYSQEDVLLGSPDFGNVRTTTYNYTTLASGLKVMTSVDGPGLLSDGVTDVTTYEYDALGRLTKTTDPNDITMEVLAFGTSGLPSQIKDQKEFIWELDYDLEGQLISSAFRPTSVNDVTTYSYDIIGQMTSSTDSLGRTWDYLYDEARRLVRIEAPSGETIDFEHDAMGNVTQTKYSDASAVMTYLEETQYDELGRILQALGSNSQIMQFSHDVEDNLATVTDSIGLQSSNSYDALNRLTAIVDRANYTTVMEHDESDQLTSFTDPRGIETQMVYNGFGELVSEVSADRGTMSYTYNNRGLPASMTDGRGTITNYTYDDGGRVTWKKFPADSALDQRFVYWTMTTSQKYNRGDLRYVDDQSGRTLFSSNTNRGTLQNDWRQIDGIQYKVKYLTREEGELYRMEYPSKSRIYVYYNTDGELKKLRWFAFDEAIGSYVPSQTVIENMEYLPMGPLSSARFGDVGVMTASYDSSYRLTGLTDNYFGTILRDETYNWTTRDNLAGVTSNLDALQNQSFVYTSREKLSSADGAWGEFDYGYDAVGNRSSFTSLVNGTSVLDLYTYPATNNQLQSVAFGGGGTRALTYDAAGNVTYDNRNSQGYSYTYDAANRMSTFSINGVVQAEYEYNFLGQQVIRRLTQTGETIHSVHDAAGNRIAEYLYDEVANTSSLIREYIWANNMLVGVFENGQMYFVRTDHIGRPVFATDTTGTKVWDASYLPFGGVQSSSGPNPDLRFPGQWFQSETGLHQNWMRDYDPTLGRYLQADPLGLVDGASVYGYALQNPGRYTDPRGEFVPILLGVALGFALDFALDQVKSVCGCDNQVGYMPDLPVWPVYGAYAGAFGGFEQKSRTGIGGGGRSGNKTSSWSRYFGSDASNPAGQRRRQFGRRWANRIPYVGTALAIYEAAQITECIVSLDQE